MHKRSKRKDSNVEPSKPRTASDIINSFLKKKNETRKETHSYSPKFRSASDVINSFLQKEKPTNVPSRPKFRSALDVINSHLQKTAADKESIRRKSSHKRKRIETVEMLTSDSDSSVDNTVKKRRINSNTPNNSTKIHSQRSEKCQVSIGRSGAEISKDKSAKHVDSFEAVEIQETTSFLEEPIFPSTSVNPVSVSYTLPENVVQHGMTDSITADEMSYNNLDRAVSSAQDDAHFTNSSPSSNETNWNNSLAQDDTEKELATPTSSNEVIENATLTTANVTSHINLSLNAADNANAEPNDQSAQKDLTKGGKTSSALKKPAPQKCIPRVRQGYIWKKKPNEVPDETGKVREILVSVHDYKIPKSKYDEALEILNSDESRYDETPVNYFKVYKFNKRKTCQNRRFHEATYEHEKVENLRHTSLTRILWEMSNCLKNGHWQEMAELVYFGCDVMTINDKTNSKGTAFFTYALLGLLMDSSTDSLSTLESKNSTIVKYLKALGAEEDEYEAFMRELNLIQKEIDTISANDSTVCELQEDEL